MTAEGRTGAELQWKFKCLRGEAKRCKGGMQDSSSEGGIGIPRAEDELMWGRCGADVGQGWDARLKYKRRCWASKG